MANEMREIRVAILGKTGTGKSAVGNSLLGRDKFSSKMSASSVSKECQLGEAGTPIGKLMVVDTPGLFDTTSPSESTLRELVKCIGMLAPGPHIFMIVLSADRFSRDETESVDILTQILKGGGAHVIAVFTRKDLLEDDDQTIQTFLREAPEHLKTFLGRIGERYTFICNKNRGSHQQDVKNMHTLIQKTVQQNHGQYFEQNLFQGAEDVIRKDIQERQKKQNISDDECRREIRTELVRNDQSMFSKIVNGLRKLIKIALPLAGKAISAIFGENK